MKRLIVNLAENKIIKSEEYDLYLYGMQQALAILLNIMTVLLIGIILNMLWYSIVFMVAFVPLRIYAGGYHAKSKGRCYLYSILLVFIALEVTKLFPWDNLIFLTLAIIIALIIHNIGPVESPNKKLNSNEILVYKRRARSILWLETICMILANIFRIYDISLCIFTALCSVAFLLVIQKFKLN